MKSIRVQVVEFPRDGKPENIADEFGPFTAESTAVRVEEELDEYINHDVAFVRRITEQTRSSREGWYTAAILGALFAVYAYVYYVTVVR